MIKKTLAKSLLFVLLGSSAFAAIKAGDVAPDFTGVDTNGKTQSLSDFKGKTVILEWTNHECPYVVKHYETKNMQKLQEEYTSQDIVWLSIASSAKGKQGYTTAEEANNIINEVGAKASARILDADGTIGKLYDAKTTPEIFIINEEGKVIYDGAIDSISTAKHSDVEKATNYVTEALNAKAKGEPIKVASTTPYGCSVKY